MNKFKSTFLRHSKDHEEKRSDVFLKRLTEEPPIEKRVEQEPPKVQFQDLSESESKAYLAWWKDLDPFNIGKSDNIKVFKFVSRCNLPDDVLEKILFLFQNEKNGLNKEQFFAMLRLISHAQNGRSISRDLVHLGAPLPRFQAHTKNALEIVDNDIPSWMITKPTLPVAQPELSLLDTPIQTPITTTRQYSHSRSRSVPYANSSSSTTITPDDRPGDALSPALFQFDTVMKQRQRRSNHSGHVSLNSDSLQKILDSGPPLLLTQGFKPKFIEDDDNASIASSSKKYNSNNPFNNNPFDTDDSMTSTPRQEYENNSPPYFHNDILNSKQIVPPPVPPQSTKPLYPKYARR